MPRGKSVVDELVFTPSQFVEVFNQTLEVAYPQVIVEGEVAELKASGKGWASFSIKDETALIRCFGSEAPLKGIEDGMLVRVVAAPKLTPKFGFNLSYYAITPVGEGSIRRAFELLRRKLEAEGLFAAERKRQLPELPKHIGLISSRQAAGYEDFIKVLQDRWGDSTVSVADVRVQGEHAAKQITKALEYFNQQTKDVEVLLIVRGGGSAEDLIAFNDEALTRAIAASRIPTVTAIGHERDLHLADLAADYYAPTPTAAAAMLFPDRHHWLDQIERDRNRLQGYINQLVLDTRQRYTEELRAAVAGLFDKNLQLVAGYKSALAAYNPDAVLRRGYSILTSQGSLISRVHQVVPGQPLQAQVSDGIIETEVKRAK